jgi:hypothetical protein
MTVNVIGQIPAGATPAPPAPSGPYQLAYAPPTLVSPVTVTLPASTSVNTKATGSSTVGLDNTKDYIIVMPVLRTGPVGLWERRTSATLHVITKLLTRAFSIMLLPYQNLLDRARPCDYSTSL